MAVTSLAFALTDYRDAASAEILGGSGYSSLETGEQAVVDRLIRTSELEFWTHPPVKPPWFWTCLRRTGTMTLWADVAEDADVTVSGGAFSGGATTVTASEATFYSNMVGHSIVIDGVGTFVIASYTSSTVISVTGDASTASADVFSITGDGVYPLDSTFWRPISPKLLWMDNQWVDEPLLWDEGEVNVLRAQDDSTGYPIRASIRWKTSDGTAAQGQELIVWPRPQADYPISLPHQVQPQGMSDANPYPLGGPEMADALLSCVLATCEKERFGSRGDRWAEYQSKAAIAVQADQTGHHNFYAGIMRPDGRSDRGRYGRSVKDLILTTSGV